MEVDTVLSDFESSDFGEMVRKHLTSFTGLPQAFLKKKKENSVKQCKIET